MHPIESSGTSSVPAFLAKLWRLVEEQETNSLISWSQDGKSFIIQNQAKFAKELLPLNYKHNNMASFIRQLNMYGFHKITSIDNGGLKFDKDEMEFSHPYFQKGHPYLLEHIKRKIANPKHNEAEKTAATKAEHFNRVLHEVKNMRGRQDSLDTRFSAMKQENEALWREVAILRQKHMKQQQIVNKLIQFLVTLVQPQRSGLGNSLGKRRFQLMINDAPQSKVKKSNQTGPIISELLEQCDSDMEADEFNFTNVQSPGSSSSKDYDNSAGSSEGINFDDIDEIDTNNMAIYSGAPVVKKERRSRNNNFTGKLEPIPTRSTNQQKHLKIESNKNEPIIVSPNPSPGKSLLLSMAEKSNNESDENIMLDMLNDEDVDLIGDKSNGNGATSTITSLDPLVAQNTLDFDQTSQDVHILGNNDDDDNIFEFDDKKDDTVDSNALKVIKFNPPHTNDIVNLQSTTDYTTHIDNVQNDLNSLKDLLSNDAYQLDANQLLGMPQQNGNSNMNVNMSFGSYDMETIAKLFGNDDIIGYELPSNMELFEDVKKDGQNARSELMEYQPFNNNLDLNELLQNVGDGLEQEKV
ncbi:heat shock factor protein isoform X2 [Chironomus tepperi]|uniref:heat shock factor protein isoform X2 n=1 Tax=Chironomus tepperi TaxID=113505 RepID=UPI00391EE9DD